MTDTILFLCFWFHLKAVLVHPGCSYIFFLSCIISIRSKWVYTRTCTMALKTWKYFFRCMCSIVFLGVNIPYIKFASIGLTGYMRLLSRSFFFSCYNWLFFWFSYFFGANKFIIIYIVLYLFYKLYCKITNLFTFGYTIGNSVFFFSTQ